MEPDVVMVLTSKSFDTMVAEGGSGDWRANEDQIRKCRWIVAARNRHSDWAQGDEAHGTAFLIGKIVGVKPSPDVPGRVVILFNQYADLNIPTAWDGQRNPVAYTTLNDLALDAAALDWKPFPNSSQLQPSSSQNNPSAESVAPALVLERAKLMIAEALSIKPSNIEITIRV
jgi:hypothetical protein